METLFKQKESLYSVFDYLIENGRENKYIAVHPQTYRKL
jgi:hypothetical protein